MSVLGRIVVAHPSREMWAKDVARQEGIEPGRVQFSNLVSDDMVYVVDLDETYRFGAAVPPEEPQE
jgi:hypothetical protein